MGVHIIAEAGVNHNGDAERAAGLVDAAVEAGADAVKFQTFRAEALASRAAPKAAYQQHNTGDGGGQVEMLKALELSHDDHRMLAERCARRGIGFLSSPFDPESLRFLTEDLDLDTIKLGSGEITNGPQLVAAGRAGKHVILSTGMSTLSEVSEALDALARGYSGDDAAGDRETLAGKVTLLHCTSAYPAPPGETNLLAMETLRKEFGLPVGLSDHTEGINIAIAAAALGAVVIEKHFTLDRSLPGPDHAASLEPDELAAMVRGIRQVESALGDGDKRPAPSELANMEAARKSLVAMRPIRKDEKFSAENLGVKRPGSGISPMEYWAWLGRAAPRDFEADEVITP